MNAPRELDWSGANQRVLAAEFTRLAARFGLGEGDAAQQAVADARAALPAPAALDTLVALFALSPFERDLLLLAAGADLDPALAGALAPTGGRASVGLALERLADGYWSALTPVAPLRRYRLLVLEEEVPLSRAALRVDERVLHFLAGLSYLDHRLAPLLTQVPAPALVCPEQARAAQDLAGRLGAEGPLAPVVLTGDDPEGQEDVAQVLAATLGLSLYRLRGSDIPASPHEQAALVALWQREAALLGAGLLVTHDADTPAGPLQRFVEAAAGLVMVAGPGAPALTGAVETLVVNRPDAPGQRALWRAALGQAGLLPADKVESLAGHYRFSARAIDRLAQGAMAPDGEARLDAACQAAGPAPGDLVQVIVAREGGAELVLPEPQRQVLGQIERHLRHRLQVHHDWGFARLGPRGLGLASPFWGEAVTGKTLAAEVLASRLRLALYRVDLSAVVSKYIGETEKNLRQVFDAAEARGAILLFDEADALFGKRSEVKDSHDRYANIEVSYLLQRMEAYRGLAILTTNHKAAMDTAFTRRLRFVVHFPFPDAAQREAIWRATFPAAMPRADLDFARLAQLAVPGGTIRNIALAAAFLAADEGSPVSMAHLRRAAHLEGAKRDKPFTDAETRGWA